MTDLHLGLLVAAVLYLGECCTLVGREVVAFTAPWLGRWSLKFPKRIPGGQNLGVVWSNPVPPLGTTFFSQAWPFSLSPQGLLCYNALSIHPRGRIDQDGRYLAWPEVKNVSVRERHVFVNGRRTFKADSSVLALAWGVLLSALHRLPENRRAATIDQILARALDSAEVERRLSEYRSRSRWLRRLGILLMAYVFLLCPAVALAAGLPSTWIHLLGGVVLLSVSTAWMFHREHVWLYPDAAVERIAATGLIAVVPIVAMRAHDYLARPLFAGCHPAAVAYVLLGKKEFREFMRKSLLDARQPAFPEGPAGTAARATEAWFRGYERRALEKFARKHGIDPVKITMPPSPGGTPDGGTPHGGTPHRSYCPRCHRQFTARAGKCQDCGGVALKALRVPRNPGRDN